MQAIDRGLVADRFLREPGGLWRDAASGERVHLRVRPPASPAVRAGWLDRCATLCGVWHPHLISPLDYGLLPDGRRFEAMVAPAAAPRVPAARRRVLDTVEAFLLALGLSPGRRDDRRVFTLEGRLAVMTDAETGWPLDDPAGRRRASRGVATGAPAVIGVRLQPRAALGWVTGVLDSTRPGEPRVLRLRAVRGAGWRTLRGWVAREARERGYVPLSAAVAAARPDLVGALEGRHVLLIDERPGPSGRARRHRPDHDPVADVLLRRAHGDARAHVLLSLVGEDDLDALDLDPLSAEQLEQMVVGCLGRRRARLTDAAIRAGGNPGRFLELLGVRPARSTVLPRARLAFVRESAAVYRVDAASGRIDRRGESAPDRPAGVSRRATALRQRAASLAGRGRHAAAARMLRAALAAGERWGDRDAAAEAALALGGLFVARRRLADAVELFGRAARDGDSTVRVAATVALAGADVERGRLVEAEAASRAAVIVATRQQEVDLASRARLTLASALRWLGRDADAARDLAAWTSCDPAIEAHRLRQTAEVALARGCVKEAGRTSAVALDLAQRGGDANETVGALAVMAAVATTVGDATGARAHLAAARREAQQGRVPMAWSLARLVVAEGWARAGRPAEARNIAVPLRRHARSFPRLFCARLDAVLAVAGDAAAAEALARFETATGARLALRVQEDVQMEALEAAAEIMRSCQDADTPAEALAVVCRTLLEHLRARGVAVVGRAAAADATLAQAGPTWSCLAGAAPRVLASGVPASPQLCASGVESGVPVRYAGQTIGAVVCRWTVDADVQGPQATALLTAAATACAPAVRQALDDRLTPGSGDRPGASTALLGESPAMAHVRALVDRAARAPFGVLVVGESGVGKELVARAIHAGGPRRGHRLCALNCAAISDDLLEAELFGHTRGAFTGAVAERTGLFEEADGGTLFLDEVSELSPRAQAKLLRAIQEGEVRRLGENLPRRVDVRIVAATNRLIEREVDAGRFRADLRYRLDILRIEVPPLRERAEDVPLLAGHFWRQTAARAGSHATLAPETLAALARYEWPGNVRELQNVIASLAVHIGARGRVRPEAIPAHVARAAAPPAGTLDEARTSFERRFVRAALARAGGHRGRAAHALGISRQGLAKLIKRLDLEATG